MRGSKLLHFLVLLVLISCGQKAETLTGIDWEDWKTDRNGCLHRRESYATQLEQQRGKLKSRSEMEIVNMMGKPDQTELAKRNQKFYSYFISGGPECNGGDSKSRKLVIRFNATGLAKEVTLE